MHRNSGRCYIRVNLENIMFCEISQTHTKKEHFHVTNVPKIITFLGDKGKIGATRNWKDRNDGFTNMYLKFHFRMIK